MKEEFYSILDMHELLISLVTDWINNNNTVTEELKADGDKMIQLLNEGKDQTTKEKSFDFSDIDMDKMDEKFIQRLYGSYCVTANYGRAVVAEEG